MRQVVQSVGRGRLRLAEVTRPSTTATEVLLAPEASVLSPGTERAVRDLARTNLLGKAAARPDLVRQVRRRLRDVGPAATVRSVRDRLGEEMPLGYSSAGTVVQVGEAVPGLAPGMRVAAAGAGHGELQVVSGLLAVPLPDGVPAGDAAFAGIGSVALHALRLGEVGPGSRVVVLGLGLVGQLAVRLAVAAGADVAGIDPREDRRGMAVVGGASLVVPPGDEALAGVQAWSRGRGADAVLVAAATASSDPARAAADLARQLGHVVVVGDVGLDLDRRPLYAKELRLVVARSYGPGRYDPTVEQLGVPHPDGLVPWPARRNLETFVDLLASGRLQVADLVTHELPFADAEAAYALLDDDAAALGVRLRYAPDLVAVGAPLTPTPHPVAAGAAEVLGIVGAGRFVSATLLPALAAGGFPTPAVVCSARGGSAARLVEQGKVTRAVAGLDDVLADATVGTVVVATPHAEHAEQVVQALEAGRHVWCEKPLALDHEQLALVRAAWVAGDRHLLVGFNRRHAPTVVAAQQHLRRRTGPLVVTYRVATPALPPDHWYHDRRQGGRLIGELCHAVDTCAALVGSPVRLVQAAGGVGADEEALLAEHLVVTIAYDDGSLAAITWTPDAAAGTSKERIEAHGGGRSVVVDDFVSIALDGGRPERSRQDKGHAAMASAFRLVLGGEGTWDTEAALASSAATLAAAEALLSGSGVVPERGRPVPPTG
jgi:predicted dehydrogenase/threonine dehydrogenase-like Zn-dependent dehydrogenase